MDLSDFVARYASERRGTDLLESSPAGRRLTEKLAPDSARALIATMFWRAWLASDIASGFLSRVSGGRGVVARSRTIVVPRPLLSRFDLVILDPAMRRGGNPRYEIAMPQGTPDDLLFFGALRAFADDPVSALGDDALAVTFEAGLNRAQPWEFVLAPEPQQERLSVPRPAVTVDDGAGHTSTAGVVVEDLEQPDRFGVTAALHAVDAATSLTVGGVSGKVIRTDSVTDSAFIEVDRTSIPALNKKGVLSGVAPRGNQNAEFEGIVAKPPNPTSTIISGWDPQVPNPGSRRQACVYTRRDAQPGDSGCALVTDDGWIAGFAFERSKPGEVPEQCAWIWADSVLKRLNVKLA